MRKHGGCCNSASVQTCSQILDEKKKRSSNYNNQLNEIFSMYSEKGDENPASLIGQDVYYWEL